jgi:very-short-patch-repair endonuclease
MTTLRALDVPVAGQTLEDWVTSTWHAHTAAELQALFSRRRVDRALRDGHLVRMAPNAYLGAHHVHSLPSRIDAALLWAGPRASVCGPTALHLYRVFDAPDEPIEIVVPEPERLAARPRWVRVRRVRYPYRTVSASGWQTVHVATAICQAFGEINHDRRAGMVIDALARRVVLPSEIVEALEAMPRVKARRALEGVLRRYLEGNESYLEYHSAEHVFVGSEFDRFVRQHTIQLEARRYRVDMYDALTRTAVEIDGAGFHREADRWQRDLRRDVDLASLGIQTVRFSYRDLHQRPEWCRQRVREILASRTPVA